VLFCVAPPVIAIATLALSPAPSEQVPPIVVTGALVL
jgi:hypothetical protein